MGEDYAARARAIWEALVRGQAETIGDWLADDIDWRSAGGETLRGKDRLIACVEANLPSLSAVAHDFERIGDCVIIHGSLRRFRDGGFLDVQPVWVLCFRDGLLVEASAYDARSQAVAAIERFDARPAT